MRRGKLSIVVLGAVLALVTGCSPPVLYPTRTAPEPPGGAAVDDLAGLLVERPPSTVEIVPPEAPDGNVDAKAAVTLFEAQNAMVSVDLLKLYGFKRAVYRSWRDDATNTTLAINLIEFDGPLGAAKWTTDLQGIFADPAQAQAAAALENIKDGKTFVLKASQNGETHTEAIFGHGRVSAWIDMVTPSGGEADVPLLVNLSELQFDRLP